MESLKSIFNTSNIIIGATVSFIVMIILLILGWKPVAVEVDAGPISIEFAPSEPTEAIKIAATSTLLPIASNIAPGSNVIASRPTSQEYETTLNIWDYFDDEEKSPTSPTTLVYDVSINSTDKYRWGAIWCGIDESTLQNILQPLSMTLIINGIPLASEKIWEFDETNGQLRCHRWVTSLSDWQSGTKVELELSYFLSRTIFDGYEVTQAGEYHLIIIVHVN